MIKSLRLQHFRSYGDASFKVGDDVNIVVGPNASGKTNILEGVLVLARGGSYRAKDAELVQFEAPWARLDAETEHGPRTVKLTPGDGGKWLKGFIVDDQPLARLLQARTLPVVLFEPNDLLLLSGSPELRRSFLDDLIEQTVSNYSATRRHYKRVLAQRNALLKQPGRGQTEQLFVWNLRLSELGGKIVRERAALTQRFAERMSELYGRLAGLPKETPVQLTYAAQFPLENYETTLLHKLEANIDLDRARGYTGAGPHRDDLRLELDGHEASISASRGETRTLVLALKILELQLLEELRGAKPLLLLDDVFSELDAERRRALVSFVSGYQTFITTTDADMVAHYFEGGNVIATTRSS